jgi:metal-responsive CopG/Arc/MetJ family transcriptional regulator
MQVQLDKHIQEQLEAIATKQGRDLSEILQEAAEQYIQQQTEEDRLRAEVRQVMAKHAALYERLANN